MMLWAKWYHWGIVPAASKTPDVVDFTRGPRMAKVVA
jgi:hypothetical protein